MSDEVDFHDYGLHSLGVGQEAWFPIFNPDFDSDHWQRISVFPKLTRPASGQGYLIPMKVTIVEEDWGIDEWLRAVCWVLIRNTGPRYAAEFHISSIIAPNR